jgi:hypothetical protein
MKQTIYNTYIYTNILHRSVSVVSVFATIGRLSLAASIDTVDDAGDVENDNDVVGDGYVDSDNDDDKFTDGGVIPENASAATAGGSLSGIDAMNVSAIRKNAAAVAKQKRRKLRLVAKKHIALNGSSAGNDGLNPYLGSGGAAIATTVNHDGVGGGGCIGLFGHVATAVSPTVSFGRVYRSVRVTLSPEAKVRFATFSPLCYLLIYSYDYSHLCTHALRSLTII